MNSVKTDSVSFDIGIFSSTDKIYMHRIPLYRINNINKIIILLLLLLHAGIDDWHSPCS